MIIIRYLLLLLVMHSIGTSAYDAHAADKPNFVWILSEDNSIHYQKLFFPAGTPTPNIEKLGTHGLIFNHAFSNAPVCSVARSTLATGILAPRVGMQFHRKSKPVQLPAGYQTISQLMMAHGYYATNNSKTDYNFKAEGKLWDESSRKASWRNRKDKTQPFYHMESHAISHESSLHFNAKQMHNDQLKTDPKSVQLAPYHPDTPLMRYTYARYHDRQMAIDNIVGKVVEKLKADGELENTFIFYFGDHGGVLPRSKGYAYESGLHVPFVVRVPENFKHLVKMDLGARVDGFVSFIDFGPTMLNLAGIDVPEYIDGKPFLGPKLSMDEVNKRDETFGYADRFDEKYDLIRTLRKGRFKYHRNFHSFYPDGLQNNYRYKMLAYEEWRKLFNNGKLNGVQRQFFEPRPVEALYDVESDPHEVKNLAGDPKYKMILEDLRGRLFAKMKALPDSSLYPESYLVKNMVQQPVAFSKNHRAEIGALLDTANLALLSFEEARPKLVAALQSENAHQRQWALTVCANFGQEAKALVPQAKTALKDEDLLVRMRAAEFLVLAVPGPGGAEGVDIGKVYREALQQSQSDDETLILLNSVVFLQDGPAKLDLKLKAKDVAVKSGQVPRRIEYLFK